MTDPTAQAKSARETLSQALRALQSDPTVPASLSAVAEPVAQAMGALHAIERSGSVATAPAARDAIRAALGLLQTQSTAHPAVGTATEAVASSLGLVFQLVKLGEAEAAAPVAPPPAAFQPAPVAAPAPAFQQAPSQPAFQAPVQPAAAPAPAFQPQPVAAQPAAPAANPYVNPFPAAAAAPAPAVAQPQAARPVAAAPAPAGDVPRFDASLGTSSATNFYKGLSGNDVVEHGGLFVATYNKIPKMGASVSLHVSLPGGYEFDCLAQVAWTRAGADDGAQPGFGARLTQVTPEARQLIYRYTRNREPLFHDDL